MSLFRARLRSTRNLLLAAPLLVALEGSASAQAATVWKECIFRPSVGEWIMEPGPAGGLNLVPLDPATPSSVELLLQPGTPGALQTVQVDFEPFDPATSATIAPGAGFEFTAYGEVGGLADQPMGTLHAVKQPSGGVEYVYDFSALGVSTVTIEFWDGATLVASYPGVSVGVGGTGGGPFFTPNCTCPSCPASWWCCWLGAVYYSNGVWHNAWNCSFPIEWNNSSHNANRMTVMPEDPTLPVGDLERCVLGAVGIPHVGLTDLTLTGFTPIGASYCAPNPNSTGQTGTISALGSGHASDNDLALYAFQLPNNSFGYFVVSPFQGFVAHPGGSQGNLCLGSSLGRFVSQLASTGSNGFLSLDVDLTSMPQSSGPVAVQAGQTWNFQCWYRDFNPGPTSNFTSGYSITFQ